MNPRSRRRRSMRSPRSCCSKRTFRRSSGLIRPRPSGSPREVCARRPPPYRLPNIAIYGPQGNFATACHTAHPAFPEYPPCRGEDGAARDCPRTKTYLCARGRARNRRRYECCWWGSPPRAPGLRKCSRPTPHRGGRRVGDGERHRKPRGCSRRSPSSTSACPASTASGDAVSCRHRDVVVLMLSMHGDDYTYAEPQSGRQRLRAEESAEELTCPVRSRPGARDVLPDAHPRLLSTIWSRARQ
jgi:hypothetical protein